MDRDNVYRLAFVYFIYDYSGGGTGAAVKIGHARNPASRLRELQTGNPRQLGLEWVIQCSEPEARRLERELHKRFAPWWMGGEWFRDCVPLDECLAARATRAPAPKGASS